MSSKELLAHLRNGAALKTRWECGKTTHELILPLGHKIHVQYRTIQQLLETGTLLKSVSCDYDTDYFLQKAIT